MHTNQDREDPAIIHTPYELIDRAADYGYDVLAITHHYSFFYHSELKKYAEKKGILLIPGAEARIENYDVLVLGITELELRSLKTLNDLEKIKDKNHLIIAPHPFYTMTDCLKENLIRYIHYFDAIEYHFFYLPWFNLFNKKAEKVAKKYSKALVGNSDCHLLWQLNKTYTLVDAEKNLVSVFNAIKKNKVKLVTNPLSFVEFVKFVLFAFKNRLVQLGASKRKSYK